MVILRGGPIAELVNGPMPGIGDVVATSDLGSMPLAKAIADPRRQCRS